MSWANMLDGECFRNCGNQWGWTDGASSISNGHDFSYSMEVGKQEFIRSLETHTPVSNNPFRSEASWWSEKTGVPVDELTTKVKFAFGRIFGTYQPYEKAQSWTRKTQPLVMDQTGPSGEVAVSDKFLTFYINKTMPLGTKMGRLFGPWIDSFPQGFSCGKADPLGSGHRLGFVPVNCSEVVVKVAEMKGCWKDDEKMKDTDDCLDFDFGDLWKSAFRLHGPLPLK